MSVFAAALVMLPFLHLEAQENKTSDSCLEVSLVTRAEYSSHPDYQPLGNTSFYAVADGSISENLTFSSELHLLSAYPGDLYTGSLYSNTTNWLDWAYLTYSAGSFEFTVGKDILKWGTSEMQEYDFDQYYEFSSHHWMNTPVYQWGVSAAYTDDALYAALQVATSPYGERPFSSGLFAYSAFLQTYSLDWFQDYASLNFIQTPGGSNFLFFNLGTDFTIGEQLRLNLDATFNLSDDSLLRHEPGSARMLLTYSPLEKLSLLGCFGADASKAADYSRTYGGLAVNWFPWEPLRVHALGAYDSFLDSPVFNLGLTWTISL